MPTLDPRIVEQFEQRAPFRLTDATLLVLCHVGSHSHNTYIPKTEANAVDDMDYMGVIIPPDSYTFGIKSWEGLNFQFEELDVVFYSFRKFVELLIKSNPNVLGMLWMRPEDIVTHSDEWRVLVSRRGLFSSRRAYPAFIGYAHSQLRKMTNFDIDTQNEWDYALKIIEEVGYTKNQIVNGDHRNMPDTFSLQMSGLLGETPSDWGQDYHGDNGAAGWAAHVLDHAIESIQKIHARHFQGYMGEKRKTLVRRYGYDTKNAAHLIRLMRMCCEFLETGELQVFRTEDAQELRDIKSGLWTLDAVKEAAEKLFKRAARALLDTALPDRPDLEKIDSIVQYAHLSAYRL